MKLVRISNRDQIVEGSIVLWKSTHNNQTGKVIQIDREVAFVQWNDNRRSLEPVALDTFASKNLCGEFFVEMPDE